MLVFLVLITSGLQYLVQRMNYNRDLKRIEWIVGQARQAAWGAKLNPIEGQRKVSTVHGAVAWAWIRTSVRGTAVTGTATYAT